jgi:hypothetical protein
MGEQTHTLVGEVGIRFNMVRSLNKLRDGEGVGAMGEVSLLAVVTQHPRFTMLTIVIAEDAAGASRIELE